MVNNLELVYILDREYQTTGLIDEYYSLIWTTRFRGAGEAVLELPATRDHVDQLLIGKYLMLPSDANTLMVIDTLRISSSFEEGQKLTVTAHGLESLLGKRVAHRINAAIETNPALIIKGLLNDNAIKAENSKRNFPKMKLGAFLEDVDKEKWLTYYIDGDNVYDLIEEFANYADLGWRIIPDYKTGGMTVETYRGKRRTYDQTDNPWVVFSSSYDNLISSSFLETELTKYNVMMYKGPEAYYEDGKKLRDEIRGSVWSHDFETANDTAKEPSGLDRREAFYQDNQAWNNPDSTEGELYSQEEMAKLIKGNAVKTLKDASEKDAFEGEVDTLRQFTYGIDFEIGDICQMSTEYGIDAIVRVEEVVQSMDGEGYKLVPTFVVLDWDEKGKERRSNG